MMVLLWENFSSSGFATEFQGKIPRPDFYIWQQQQHAYPVYGAMSGQPQVECKWHLLFGHKR